MKRTIQILLAFGALAVTSSAFSQISPEFAGAYTGTFSNTMYTASKPLKSKTTAMISLSANGEASLIDSGEVTPGFCITGATENQIFVKFPNGDTSFQFRLTMSGSPGKRKAKGAFTMLYQGYGPLADGKVNLNQLVF